MKDFQDHSETLDVSIVMPCLDEALTVGACVVQAQKALATLAERHGLSGEVIIADNGSTDGSQEIARTAGARVVDIADKGYGAALRGGFAAARGRFLVMGDSDCSYDFTESVPMIERLMDGAELCMGSRFRGEIKPGAMPWKNRYIGNPALSGLLRMMFRTQVSDSHCGLRAITAEALDKLGLSSNGMEFASEMVLKASLKKLRIEEVPVTLSPDGRERMPHLNPWRDGLRHLFYMLMLCPSWLFLAPAALLGGAGLVVFAALLAAPADEMAHLLGFALGDHWAVAAAGAMIMAAQMAVFGLATMLVGYRNGYMPLPAAMRRLMQGSTLGTWLAAGMGVTALGLLWAGLITAGWVQSQFGALDQIRPFVAAVTTMTIGTQIAFGGFFLSILAGNRLQHFAPA